MHDIPQSVLITRHDKIGDFVLSLPLCKAIKTQYPDIELSVLVAPVNEVFANSIPFIDNVICYYQQEPGKTLQTIRQLQPEASISCFIDTGLGKLLWKSGIGIRVAPATKLAQLFFNRRVKQRRSRVEKTEYAYNIELGCELFPGLSMALSPPVLSFSVNVPGERKRVAFHPGFGGSSDGNLMLDDYLALARKAARIPGVDVVFTFGPDDNQARQKVEAALDFPVKLIDGFASLSQFCEFLQSCHLFVSTSTGPMHLAGAVNTPTLSFFGDSLFASSARWQPLNEPQLQHNFMLPANYSREQFAEIEQTMLEILK